MKMIDKHASKSQNPGINNTQSRHLDSGPLSQIMFQKKQSELDQESISPDDLRSIHNSMGL